MARETPAPGLKLRDTETSGGHFPGPFQMLYQEAALSLPLNLAKPGMRTIRGLKAGEESQQVQDLVPVQVHCEEHSKTALCLSFPRSDSTEEETYLFRWVEGTESRVGGLRC